LLNDFLLLTLPNKMIGSGHQFSFDKHSDMKLKLYRKVSQGTLKGEVSLYS